jgi:hypothetical protein
MSPAEKLMTVTLEDIESELAEIEKNFHPEAVKTGEKHIQYAPPPREFYLAKELVRRCRMVKDYSDALRKKAVERK